MIDICGIFNFRKKPADNYVNPFLDIYNNDSRNYDLKETKVNCGRIFYVKRKESRPSYSAKTMHIFSFGTAIVNRNYKNIASSSQKILQPPELYDFYGKFNTEMANYLKGNFSIVIYDDAKNELVLMSSKLNTLSLFYCYRDNIFVFSSSIKAMLKVSSIPKTLDEKALVEHLLFYHPLADKTYFKNIFQLLPAHIVKVNQNGLQPKKYWRIEDLFRGNKLIPEDEALYKCVDLMKENLKVYTSDTKKFLLSLTAGFDSRTNLALTERDPENFLCYSYGMPGSKQIEIPLLISGKLGLNYKTVYLDEAYERNYKEYALRALDYSNGSAPILRANFPYVFEQLSTFSTVNVTGLFGSEIIKCFRRANEQLSWEAMNLFSAGDFEKNYQKAVKNIKKIGYINNSVIDKYSQEILDDFSNSYIKRLAGLSNIARFYVFLFEESIRKYFMQEIMIERRYVDNRMPYLDDDFLELIFKTPFSGFYKGKSGNNFLAKKDSQLFYAKIIQITNPALGDIVTDRGYKPKDLLSAAFKVFPLYLINKIRKNIKGKDTFKSELWSKNMVEKYIYKIGKQNDIFADKLVKNFEAGFHLKGNFRFFSAFSLRLWLSDL
ncbi:MAG: hypothetical protein WC330_00050 [Candidatus Omnitrophota bacterium]|jgi:asparagine synthetase B (glutamine-hydrolysing)